MEPLKTVWDKKGIPRKGWELLEVIDTGSADSTCSMCGNNSVRYLHSIRHDTFVGELRVGCVCAEKLTDDYVNPRKQERALRNAAAKKIRDRNRAEKIEERRKKKLKEANKRHRRLKINRRKVLEAEWSYLNEFRSTLKVILSDFNGKYMPLSAIAIKSERNGSWGFLILLCDNIVEDNEAEYKNLEEVKTAAVGSMISLIHNRF